MLPPSRAGDPDRPWSVQREKASSTRSASRLRRCWECSCEILRRETIRMRQFRHAATWLADPRLHGRETVVNFQQICLFGVGQRQAGILQEVFKRGIGERHGRKLLTVLCDWNCQQELGHYVRINWPSRARGWSRSDWKRNERS